MLAEASRSERVFCPYNNLCEYFYRDSIIEAMSNEAIERRAQIETPLTLSNKVILAVNAGVDRLFKVAIIIVPIALIAQKIFMLAIVPANPVAIPFLFLAFGAPIIEEVLFRGILQNGIAKVQQIAGDCFPEIVQQTRIFVYLTSPSCRVLLVSTLFAAVHIANADSFITLFGAALQASQVFLYPTFSILYETTDDLIVPITAHITNNLAMGILMQILG